MSQPSVPFKLKLSLSEYVNPHLIWPSILPCSSEPEQEIPNPKRGLHAPPHRQSKSQKANEPLTFSVRHSGKIGRGGRSGWTGSLERWPA